MPRTISTRSVDQLAPNSGVRYWLNTKLGLTGLKNLGNTCYMNSTIQCLSATLPFARYFLDGRYKGDINMYNPLGTKGDLANTFAKLLSALWGENWNVLSPISFRVREKRALLTCRKALSVLNQTLQGRTSTTRKSFCPLSWTACMRT